MSDVDWAVWPIFLVQGIACLFLLIRSHKSFCGLSLNTYIQSILILVCFAIVASLYHDSATILHLYF